MGPEGLGVNTRLSLGNLPNPQGPVSLPTNGLGSSGGGRINEGSHLKCSMLYHVNKKYSDSSY